MTVSPFRITARQLHGIAERLHFDHAAIGAADGENAVIARVSEPAASLAAREAVESGVSMRRLRLTALDRRFGKGAGR